MHVVQESVMMIGSETMRLIYRQKAVQQNMDIQMLRLVPSLTEKVNLVRNVQEHMINACIKYINRTEVKEDVINNRRTKGSPSAKKVGKQSVLETWDTQFNAADNANISTIVADTQRLNPARRQTYFCSGGTIIANPPLG